MILTAKAVRAIGRLDVLLIFLAVPVSFIIALFTVGNGIQKFKMWEETEHICIYCNEKINVKKFLRGYDVEVEHIIPRSVLFDDSYSNKVCACSKCNKDKTISQPMIL